MASEKAIRIIRDGSAVVRLKRAGMLQSLTFKIRKVSIGKEYFVELYTPRMVDMGELHRIANELELPVEVENGRAFPEGTGAKDFMNL
jgi:hypothetical protein